MEAIIAVSVIIWLICAITASTIAANKGLSAGGYFLLGLVFGILGVLIAAVATPAPPQSPAVPQWAPGWYPDYADRASLRWFDGQQWTDHTAALQAMSAGK